MLKKFETNKKLSINPNKNSVMKKTVNIGIAIAFFLSMALYSFNTVEVAGDWDIPDKYKTMENPTEDSRENLAIAKSLWAKHCQSCHGREGLGDGPKAAELESDAGDFSSEEFQSLKDGELFYMTTFGMDEMPAYDKKIPSDEDRWMLVHYMRTMAE
jgi:mono/diheme cytochrome c family protein